LLQFFPVELGRRAQGKEGDQLALAVGGHPLVKQGLDVSPDLGVPTTFIGARVIGEELVSIEDQDPLRGSLEREELPRVGGGWGIGVGIKARAAGPVGAQGWMVAVS